jgi:segregation and condensation protein A
VIRAAAPAVARGAGVAPAPAVSEAPTEAFVVAQPGFTGSVGELATALRAGRIAPAELDLLLLVVDYLRYFEHHAERDLDLASESLPAVAQVIELKVRLLLPRPPRPVDEASDELRDEALEAVETLARLEHAIVFLRERRARRRHMVAAKASPLHFPRRSRPLQVELGQLASLAARFRRNGYFELTRDALSVPEAIRRLLRRLRRLRRADLDSLVDTGDWATRTVYFAGLLELVREGRVRACQGAPFDAIVVEPVGEQGCRART